MRHRVYFYCTCFYQPICLFQTGLVKLEAHPLIQKPSIEGRNDANFKIWNNMNELSCFHKWIGRMLICCCHSFFFINNFKRSFFVTWILERCTPVRFLFEYLKGIVFETNFAIFNLNIQTQLHRWGYKLPFSSSWLQKTAYSHGLSCLIVLVTECFLLNRISKKIIPAR